MTVQYLAGAGLPTHNASDPLEVIAARFTAQSAPADGSDGIRTNYFGTVRTLITYAGAVTSATLRMWIKNGSTGKWIKGASMALSPGGAAGTEAIDWTPGRGEEITFTLEAISPGTSGNTLAVDLAGVSS